MADQEVARLIEKRLGGIEAQLSIIAVHLETLTILSNLVLDRALKEEVGEDEADLSNV